MFRNRRPILTILCDLDDSLWFQKQISEQLNNESHRIRSKTYGFNLLIMEGEREELADIIRTRRPDYIVFILRHRNDYSAISNAIRVVNILLNPQDLRKKVILLYEQGCDLSSQRPYIRDICSKFRKYEYRVSKDTLDSDDLDLLQPHALIRTIVNRRMEDRRLFVRILGRIKEDFVRAFANSSNLRY
jgi:hypothetical protein